MYEQYLQHHGILGQKWGVRRYQNKDGSLTSAGKKRRSGEQKTLSRRQVKKWNAKAVKNGRVVDDGDENVIGVKQKNGDIIFVDRKLYNSKGIDYAESSAKQYIKEATANAQKVKKGKKFVDKEEQKLVKEMLETYDKNDPDAEEAMAILRDIQKSR